MKVPRCRGQWPQAVSGNNSEGSQGRAIPEAGDKCTEARSRAVKCRACAVKTKEGERAKTHVARRRAEQQRPLPKDLVPSLSLSDVNPCMKNTLTSSDFNKG